MTKKRAPTALRNVAREEVVLPWCPAISTSAFRSAAQQARSFPSIESLVGAVVGGFLPPASASPISSTLYDPRSSRVTRLFWLKLGRIDPSAYRIVIAASCPSTILSL